MLWLTITGQTAASELKGRVRVVAVNLQAIAGGKELAAKYRVSVLPTVRLIAKPHTIPAAAGGCPRLQGGEQSWGLKLWQGDQSWWGLEIVAPPPRVGLGLWSPPMNRSCEGLGARGHRFLRPNFPKRTEVLHTRRAIATICTRAAERPRTTACFLVLSSVVFEREQGKFDGRHKIRREPASRSLLLQSSQHACGPVRSPADPRAVAGLDMWSWAV
jgi:hypothetical protein